MAGPYLARPDLVWAISGQAGYGRSISGQTQPAGRRGWKNHLFWRVFASFLSCFLLFHGPFVCRMPFLQKKSVHLTCSGRRSAHYKVPPRIGGCHFLLCQHTNTKDIAGQSAIQYHQWNHQWNQSYEKNFKNKRQQMEIYEAPILLFHSALCYIVRCFQVIVVQLYSVGPPTFLLQLVDGLPCTSLSCLLLNWLPSQYPSDPAHPPRFCYTKLCCL